MLQPLLHVVEKMLHSGLVHVVEDGARGTGGSVDDAGKGGAAHQGIKHVFAVGRGMPAGGDLVEGIDFDCIAGEIDLVALVDAINRVGHNEEVHQLELAVDIGFGHFGVDGIENLLLGDNKRFIVGIGRPINLCGVGEHHLRPLFHG